MKRVLKRILYAGAAALAVLLMSLAFREAPVAVETAAAVRGPLQVTVDEDGEVRAHDRFAVAAPVAGRLARIDFHDGDRVSPNQAIAVIHPLPLDPRERAEANARVERAEALRREAGELASEAAAHHDQALRERRRAEALWEGGDIALQVVERAREAETTSSKVRKAAEFKTQAAASEVEMAKSALVALEAERGGAARSVAVRPPVRGRVLRVIEKSERVVAAGTPLVVVGDPSKLEVVVDVLSTDAVKIREAAPVMLERWGGPKPLRARVRTVEPYAFTKVSALGIEEQRVNVVADFVDPPGPLGDGYRVEARIVIWESADVLKVPASALFRDGDGWRVFVERNGVATQREVKLGQRGALEAEVLAGLEPGDEVIVFPSDRVREGARVTKRSRP
jgi:HlyD family secretion protein